MTNEQLITEGIASARLEFLNNFPPNPPANPIAQTAYFIVSSFLQDLDPDSYDFEEQFESFLETDQDLKDLLKA